MSTSLRQRVSFMLSKRSVIRHHQYPTRSNTFISLAYIVVISPIALVWAFPLSIRAAFAGPMRVRVLATEGEFGPLVHLLEVLREKSSMGDHCDVVLVLSRYRHLTLGDIYRNELQTKLLWGGRLSGVVQQILLLQSSRLVSVERFEYSLIHQLPDTPLEVPPRLIALREKTLFELECSAKRLVTFALHTLKYDEERNPQYLFKEVSLESVGDELASPIDYLRSMNCEVVLLGSPDTGRSEIPREFPRLHQFGELGGPHEIALASGCEYFWSDFAVGAWWTSAPFRRPVLFTNTPRLRIRKGLLPSMHVVLPAQFQTLGGKTLTLKDVLASKSHPYKAASRGELHLIRNTSGAITAAHQEMLARLDGTWVEDRRAERLQARSREIFLEFKDCQPITFASTFLLQNENFLL